MIREEFEKELVPLIKVILKLKLNENNSLTDYEEKLFIDLLYTGFSSKVKSSSATGFVISGFGSEQNFPELIEYTIDGKKRS